MAGAIRFEDVARFIRLSKFKESYYAMIGSYMDESFDMRQSGMFVVGGIMARGVPIFELERRWKALRERPDIDINYFKASQCERGTGEFAKFVADPDNIQPAERDRLQAISREFLGIIAGSSSNSSDLVVFGIGIVQEEFYGIAEDPNARAVLGSDPYRLAYDLAMIQCAATMKKLAARQKPGSDRDLVSFVCDETEQYSHLAWPAYQDLKKKNPKAEEYMATYTSADEKKCDSLQAADAVVYEIRRVLNLAMGQRTGGLREQFKILSGAGALFMIANATRAALLDLASNCKPGEPFSLDVLMESHMLDEDVELKI